MDKVSDKYSVKQKEQNENKSSHQTKSEISKKSESETYKENKVNDSKIKNVDISIDSKPEPSIINKTKTLKEDIEETSIKDKTEISKEIEVDISNKKNMDLSETKSKYSNSILLWNEKDEYKSKAFISQLQYFGSSTWFLIWFSCLLFFKSMVMNAFINASIVTLEKRYKLSSKESSMIISMYDVGSLTVVLPVSFYGRNANKPLWVGMGALLMGIGSFIFASPYVLSGFYEYIDIDSNEIPICANLTRMKIQCKPLTTFNRLQNFKYIFYISQFLTGCGSAPSYTLGFSYIEEINDKGTAAFHIGIVSAVIAIASGVGYTLCSIFLNIYVDIDIKSERMTPKDTDRWIGAWWIGFLISGFGQIITSIPLIWFPDNIQKKKNVITSEMLSLSNFLEITKSLKSIILNSTYVCICIATTLTLLAASGSNSFGPKYLEIVFGVSTSTSSLIAGIISLPSLLCGAILGGYLMKRFNWNMNETLVYMAITCLISTPLVLILLIRCNQNKMAGVNTFYIGTNSNIVNNLTSPCNEKCNCDQNYEYFRPSCGIDSINYYSPCFAGCTRKFKNGTDVTFKNCACIHKSNQDIELVYRKCEEILCSAFYIYLPILSLFFLVSYMRIPPSITATMRSVTYDDKAIALGFRTIVNRLLGSLPGPIIFGAIIDHTCILWGFKCGLKGHCLKYDTGLFTKVFCFWLLISTLLTAVIFLIPIIIRILKKKP